MYFDLLGNEGVAASPERAVAFSTSVIKSYRRVAYHNATHAFMVAHAMYNILRRNAGVFSRLEVGWGGGRRGGLKRAERRVLGQFGCRVPGGWQSIYLPTIIALLR